MSSSGTGEPLNEPDKRHVSDTTPIALLSCELCTKRKIKCDKRQPCAACQKSGKECKPVVRARLPRGRRGGRKEANVELRNRVRRLEELVQSLSGNASPPVSRNHSTTSMDINTSMDPSMTPDPTTSGEQGSNRSTPTSATNSTDISRLLGSTLWTQLSTELNGLRSVLEAHDEHDEIENSPAQSDEIKPSEDSPLSLDTYDETTEGLSAGAISKLMDMFSYRIDPVMKTVHMPTFRSSIETGIDYIGYSTTSNSFRALRSASFYAVFCSLDDGKCMDHFHEHKNVLLERWRSSTEHWLRMADMTNDHNIVIIQALIYYIAAFRTHNNGPRAWTMMGLAVRIAQSLQLHREESYQSFTFFEGEVRRRAFYCILGLDFKASLDRGTDPAVPANSYNVKFAMNLDDLDFNPKSEKGLLGRSGYTDMTFFTIASEASYLIRALNFVSAREADQPPSALQHSWEARQNAVMELDKWLSQQYLQHCDLSVPLQFAAFYLGKVMLACMQLYVVRPLQRHPAMSSPPVSAASVLIRAIETLEYREMFIQGVSEPWNWLFEGYVDWHPLAVCLAELCSPQQDSELVERAWRVADIMFAVVARQIAEGTQGTLWKPLRKLMRMAQKRRASSLAQTQQALGVSWTTTQQDMMAPLEVTGIESTMRGLDASLPTDFATGIYPMDDSWMNWQGFVDDLAQNSYSDWATNLLPFQSGIDSDAWPGV